MACKDMIATAPRRYGTRMLSADERFSADGPTARLWAALGWARNAEEVEPTEKVEAPAKPKAKKSRKKAAK